MEQEDSSKNSLYHLVAWADVWGHARIEKCEAVTTFHEMANKHPVQHTTLTTISHEHYYSHCRVSLPIDKYDIRWCFRTIVLLVWGFGVVRGRFLIRPAFCPKKSALSQIITFFDERAVTPRRWFPLDTMERDLDLALFCINWRSGPPKNIRIYKKCQFFISW